MALGGGVAHADEIAHRGLAHLVARLAEVDPRFLPRLCGAQVAPPLALHAGMQKVKRGPELRRQRRRRR